jgi:hypothetical protein
MSCAALAVWIVLQTAPVTSFAPPDPAQVAAAPSFAAGERLVAAFYFYWYRYPDEHLAELGLHFPDERAVSYESEAWHRGELEDMCAAGIDVCLPVYWGALEHYDKPDVSFSVRGLPALVAAADALARVGMRPPRIGMMYDTTTLLNDVRGVEPRGARADLRTPAGRALLCGTVRDFFCQVPPRHWAQIDGQPLVVLYSAGFAAGFDQGLFDELAASFARDFGGKQPFVVREASWSGVRTAASYAWGAALAGPTIGERAVAIGPGYDDRAVHGRLTPVREREEGRFYEKSWHAALRSGCDLALIETWNEHHEGTSIAETVEFGRTYIELTARYAALFRRREVLEGELVLHHPEPRPRQDLSWGAAAGGAREVAWRAGVEPSGLRPIPWEDGPFEVRPAGEPALVSRGATGERPTYLYFQVSDWFAFDVDADFELELEFDDRGQGTFEVQFDSRDERATLRGAYTGAARLERGAGEGWRTETVTLSRARFANRQNGLADLRLAVWERDLAVRSLCLRPRAR